VETWEADPSTRPRRGDRRLRPGGNGQDPAAAAAYGLTGVGGVGEIELAARAADLELQKYPRARE